MFGVEIKDGISLVYSYITHSISVSFQNFRKQSFIYFCKQTFKKLSFDNFSPCMVRRSYELKANFLAKFLEDLEEDCGISIQRELEEMEKIFQDKDSVAPKGINIYLRSFEYRNTF